MAIVEKVDGFFIPNVTLIGVGAAKAIPERIVYLNATKPLLVTDKGIVHTGILKQITDILDEAAMEYAIYDETVPNPTDLNVAAGVELYKKEECDSLISIGGGSSHDCCKGIGLVVSNGGKIHDYEGVDKSTCHRLLLCLLPLHEIPECVPALCWIHGIRRLLLAPE